MNKIDIISNIIVVIGSIMYVLNYKFDNGVLYMIFRIIYVISFIYYVYKNHIKKAKSI